MRPVTQRRLRAMGTDCHIVTVGPRGERHAAVALDRINELEHLWSRFLADSEVSKMNAAQGEPVDVSQDTQRLVEVAMAASELTNGLFDPTLGTQLELLGYDRSFDDVTGSAVAVAASPSRVGRPATIEDGRVTVPRDVSFDPGGIGKGLAADIVTEEVLASGAWGVMVNLGGDIRVRGLAPEGDAWVVQVSEPTVGGGVLATVRLKEGALATSTTRKRRWIGPEGDRHHVLDPATGLPAISDVMLTSVVAGEGWWAEAAATALLVSAGEGPSCAGLRVRGNGECERVGGFERYER